MIKLSEYLYEAELNLEWWNSKSPAYQKRYLSKHPNSIYAQKAKSGELEVKDKDSTKPTSTDTPKKSKDECKLDQVPLKIQGAEKKIADNKELETKKRAEYSELKKKYDSIPMPIEHYNDETHQYEWDSDLDREHAEERTRLRGHMRSVWAEVEIAQHNQEVAKRYIRKLNSFANFTKRNLGPDTSTKYAASGVAQYVDFSGMNEDSENEIMDSITKMVEKHPFMKGHLTFVGSHKSPKFKQLSQELAHDYYKADLEKRYNEAQDYIKEKEGGAYTGSEKDPPKIYEDKEHWLSEEQRDTFHYYLYTLNEKYRTIERIDRYGGIENYLRTPTYERAIKRWQRMTSRAWAYYRTDTLKNGQQGMIAFNENSFDSAELKHNVETKWHPEGCDTKKSVLDHEFAHSIWYHLGLNKEKPYGTSPLQDYIRQKMHFGKEYLKNHLSRYAATNTSEFFAEAYSEYLNNPQPREIAQKVGELLQKEIQLQGYGDNNGRDTGSQS